ncbi:uncharacterized protein LOC130157058 [Falco biarmicus]|uniref:uncharacterized protein LOC130157058 n=1 Tax=Falco biarmicus TaxID=345155 RepID=UPI0024BBEED2|nr:uncharacterized protein LOC130157058 [Falco biarmicus]
MEQVLVVCGQIAAESFWDCREQFGRRVQSGHLNCYLGDLPERTPLCRRSPPTFRSRRRAGQRLLVREQRPAESALPERNEPGHSPESPAAPREPLSTQRRLRSERVAAGELRVCQEDRILGFPQTNTSIDCDSLLPNYEAEPQSSAPPYIIAVSFDNFEPGNEIKVTLEALQGVGFKGFNLQAREIDGDVPVGTFKITDPNTKALECHNMTNSAVSQANSDVKQKVTTTWIAPHDVKDLQFIATVVQDLEKFWVGIQSKTLTPTHSPSVNGTGKSKRKLMIELECNKRGGTYTTQGRCIMVGPSGSSQNSYSGSQSGVVYTISRNGCGPGGAADAYSQNACKDSASSSSSGLIYGKSVPSGSSDSSKKVVVIANSNPFPPVRHTYPQSLGSSATRIIIQSGQRQQSSSSTSVQVSKLKGLEIFL